MAVLALTALFAGGLAGTAAADDPTPEATTTAAPTPDATEPGPENEPSATPTNPQDANVDSEHLNDPTPQDVQATQRGAVQREVGPKGARLKGPFIVASPAYPMSADDPRRSKWDAGDTIVLKAIKACDKEIFCVTGEVDTGLDASDPASYREAATWPTEGLKADIISVPVFGRMGEFRFETGAKAGQCYGLTRINHVLQREFSTCNRASYHILLDDPQGESELVQVAQYRGIPEVPFDKKLGNAVDWPILGSSEGTGKLLGGLNLSLFTPSLPQPTAAFNVTTDGLTVTLDGTPSEAVTGHRITYYGWLFGDGSTAAGPVVKHRYDKPGTYLVELYVIDFQNILGIIVDAEVVVDTPIVTDPLAAIDHSVNGLSATFDGTRSQPAPDGASIIDYAWDFGDGSTANGATTSHTYAADGSYRATLTVTDTAGRQGTTTISVAQTTYAADSFNRTNPVNWGNADVGGTWLKTPNLSIDNGTALLSLPTPGYTTQTYLNKINVRDVEIAFDFSFESLPWNKCIYYDFDCQDYFGSGVQLGAIVRKSEAGTYRVEINGYGYDDANRRLSVNIVRRTGSTSRGVAGYSVNSSSLAKSKFHVRFQAIGANPTTLRAKVWRDGTPEPTRWELVGTDSQPELQGPGYVGFAAYLTPSLVPPGVGSGIRIDNYRVGVPVTE